MSAALGVLAALFICPAIGWCAAEVAHRQPSHNASGTAQGASDG